MERRLAAILAADVVGYSRLMGADEEATLAKLNAYREIIDGLVADHRGRAFGSAGDSVIAEFPSPFETVHCAIEMLVTERLPPDLGAELAQAGVEVVEAGTAAQAGHDPGPAP